MQSIDHKPPPMSEAEIASFMQFIYFADQPVNYDVAIVRAIEAARDAEWAEVLRAATDEIELLKLAEEGAKQAFGDVVQNTRDLEVEIAKLTRNLEGAHQAIRARSAKGQG